MSEEPADPRLQRGALVAALAREDLEPYAVEELNARIAALEAEVVRVRLAMARKSSGRAAADALFSFRT